MTFSWEKNLEEVPKIKLRHAIIKLRTNSDYRAKHSDEAADLEINNLVKLKARIKDEHKKYQQDIKRRQEKLHG